MATYTTWQQVTDAANKGQLGGEDFISAIMVIGPSPQQVQQVLTTVARTEPDQPWVKNKWVQVVNGQIAINPSQLKPDAPGVAPGINAPNPFSGITGIADAIAKLGGLLAGFAQVITDVSMWRSLGWIVLGAVLLIIGIRLWLGKPALPNVPNVVPVPV